MSDDLMIRLESLLAPAAAFDVIVDVRGWWQGEIEGDTDRVGAEFSYEVPGVHRSVQSVSALDPGVLVAWEVVDANLTFASDPAEWVGTRITFDIAPAGDGSVVVFTHHGLTPALECFEACSSGWRYYAGTSLGSLLA